MGDDWGDIADIGEEPYDHGAGKVAGHEDERVGAEEFVHPRHERAPQRGHRLTREQRFVITLAVVAVVMLVLGGSIGFAVGRATAPKTIEPPLIEEPTSTLEVTSTDEPTDTVGGVELTGTTGTDLEPPPTPRQTSPSDGARIDSSRVMLRWTEVADESGEDVTYAFEIETYSNGKWTGSQTIDKLTTPSYSARVLSSLRRWRVWAVDASGNASPRSGWRTYRHSPVTTSKPKASTPSSPTSPTT